MLIRQTQSFSNPNQREMQNILHVSEHKTKAQNVLISKCMNHIFLALAGLVDLIQGSNHFFLILSYTLYGFRNKFNGLAKYYYFLRWSRFLEFSILIHNKTKFNV